MNLEVEAFQGELKALRKIYKSYKHIMAEHIPDTYFICGQGGEVDRNNLPETIQICPAYGVDWFQIYKRTDETWGPEW